MASSSTSVGTTLLTQAREKGEDYHKRLTINGRSYYVVVQKGGELTSLEDADPSRIKNLAEIFFSAHQNVEADFSSRDISHIDSQGVHFKDSTPTKTNTEVRLGEILTATLRQRDLTLQQNLSAQHEYFYNLAENELDLSKIPEFLHAQLQETGDAPYKGETVAQAILIRAKAHITKNADFFRNTIPLQAEYLGKLQAILDSDASLADIFTQSNDLFQQYLTAQSVWKMMQETLFPERIILIPDDTPADASTALSLPSDDDTSSRSSSGYSSSGSETDSAFSFPPGGTFGTSSVISSNEERNRTDSLDPEGSGRDLDPTPLLHLSIFGEDLDSENEMSDVNLFPRSDSDLSSDTSSVDGDDRELDPPSDSDASSVGESCRDSASPLSSSEDEEEVSGDESGFSSSSSSLALPISPPVSAPLAAASSSTVVPLRAAPRPLFTQLVDASSSAGAFGNLETTDAADRAKILLGKFTNWDRFSGTLEEEDLRLLNSAIAHTWKSDGEWIPQYRQAGRHGHFLGLRSTLEKIRDRRV